MRPDTLNSLFCDVVSLQGVGPKLREYLSHRLGDKIIDILFHFPVSLIDRRNMPGLNKAESGEYITTIIQVDKHIPAYKRSRSPYKVSCSNSSGFLTLVFFNARTEYLNKQLPLGEERAVSGKVEKFDGKLQMSHPDYIVKRSEIKSICTVQPVYPLTFGISQKTMNKITQNTLPSIIDLPEWIEENHFKKSDWKSWKESLVKMHNPTSLDDLLPNTPERDRLAYDELLANQLAIAISRKVIKKQAGQKIISKGEYKKKLLTGLPFKLTNDQVKVLGEITSDMEDSHRMVRLLQGDVGSGKTVVALLSLLDAVEAGMQGAFMAPTAILASQHFEWITQVIKDAGLEDKVRVQTLTGKDKGNKRKEILEDLKSGNIDIVIGTHALFQETVKFNNLAMVVIDEQQRFGVKQRLMLSSKGQDTDILLMTATPIPRTLTLTLYGDMDISLLKEKPAGRTPIDTRIVSLERELEVTDGLKRAIEQGNKAYWVCPLIEEDEEGELAAVEARYDILKKIFKDKVACIHGRMSADEKDDIMMNFKTGDTDILVATTVIEVGVDVPDATIMVVEQAERFGLSQLHQLRGRVGRGTKKSSCVLMYDTNLSENGRKRLKILRETEDGFRISEEDLMLRGGGDLIGTKQSGMPDFKIAIFPEHSNLLFTARDDTKMILRTDPTLTSERGQNLRTLLYLFEYDSHIQYLMAG